MTTSTASARLTTTSRESIHDYLSGQGETLERLPRHVWIAGLVTKHTSTTHARTTERLSQLDISTL